MTTYYVDYVSGSDSAAGTSGAPFKTPGKAHTAASPGDMIKLRGNKDNAATFYPTPLAITKANTTWTADTGHTPTFHGGYTPTPGNGASYAMHGQPGDPAKDMIDVNAANVTLSYLRVQNVGGTGVGFNAQAHNGRMLYCTIHMISSNGVIVAGVSKGAKVKNVEIGYCDISYISQLWFWNGSVKGGTGCGMMLRDCEDVRVHHCTLHHVCKEGINIDRGGIGTIIEHNTIYTINHVSLYILRTQGAHVRYNIVYHTKERDYLGAAYGKRTGTPMMVVGDESNKDADGGGSMTGHASSERQYIYGNVFIGGSYGFQVRNNTNQYETQLKKAYIGYNTFIGETWTDPQGTSATKQVINISASLGAGPHVDSLFENNVIYAPPGVPMAQVAGVSGIRFRNNAWYGGTRPSAVVGVGDITANPKLVNPTATGPFNIDNYRPQVGSPLIGAVSDGSPVFGVTPLMSSTTIGALLVSGDIDPPPPTAQAAFSLTPPATSILTGASVTFTNQSTVTGTTVSGYTWVVKRGSATTFNSTSVNLGAYTFNTAGTWSVTLTVNTAAGISDSETVTLTVTDPSSDPSVTAAFSRTPTALNLLTGTAVAFTNQSVILNTTKTGQTWEVRTSPGDVLVTSATTNNFSYTFNTAGTFVVKLTVTTAAGLSDSETVTYTITAPAVTVTADFTASDTTVNAGESVTFTNTSSATGTTITGYRWYLSTDGALAEFTTTNVTYTFTRAGVWEVALTVTTAAGESRTKSILVTVRAVDSYGAGLYKAMIVPHRAALNTSTGEQTITTAALGTLVPKAATVRLTAAVTDGTAATGALWAEGATDGSSQWSMARYAADNVSPSSTCRRYTSGKLAQTIDTTGAITGAATFARFVPGGMVINVTDAFPAAYLMEIDFYAGDDMAAACGTAVIGAIGVDVDVHTGIDQDFIYAATTWAMDGADDTGSANLSQGFALRSGVQACLRQQDRKNQSPTSLFARHSGGYIAFSGDGAPVANVFVQAHSFTESGFKLRPYSNSLASRPLGWLAVSLGGPRVQLTTEALGTESSSSYSMPFDAQTTLALMSTVTVSEAGITDATAEGQGYYAKSIYSSGAEYTTWIASQDQAATSDTASWSDNAFRAIDHDGTNKWNGSGALDESGLTVAWTNAPAAGHLMILLGIEKAEALPEEPPDGLLPTPAFIADTLTGATRLLVRFDSSTTNDNGSAITGWLWDFGDGTTSTAANPVHLYSKSGTFDVTLTVTNANGSIALTKESYITAEYPRQERYLVGPIRPRAGSPEYGDDMPLDWTGDEDIDARVGYHRHDQDVLVGLKLEPLTSEEIAQRATEADGTAALLAWNVETSKLNVIGADGTVYEV